MEKGTARLLGTGSDGNDYVVIFDGGFVIPLNPKNPVPGENKAEMGPANYTVDGFPGYAKRLGRGVFQPRGTDLVITLKDVNEDVPF